MNKPDLPSYDDMDDLDALIVEADEKTFLEETFEGEVLTNLRGLGEEAGKTVSIDKIGWGRQIYRFGKDEALLQNHIREGVTHHCTNMTDLQKPWWKKAFLEGACEGNIDNVGLISPSVFDVIKLFDPKAAEKFKLKSILSQIGISSLNKLGDEFVEQDVLGEDLDDKFQSLIAKMVEYWQQLVAPDFDVSFDNGNGDLYRKIRLIPKKRDASGALCYGGPKFDKVAKKIVDNYDGLIEHLK